MNTSIWDGNVPSYSGRAAGHDRDLDVTALPTRNADGGRNVDWYSLFVMVPVRVIKALSGDDLREHSTMLRLRDNECGDICQKVSTLTEVTGRTRQTLRRHYTPGLIVKDVPTLLTPDIRFKTRVVGDTPETTEEVLAHQWWGDDGEERWRFDVDVVTFTEVIEVDENGKSRTRKVASEPFQKVYYWWLWEDPATQPDGNAWVRRRFTTTTTRRESKKGQPVTYVEKEVDLTGLALKGALSLAAAAPDSRRTANYGIAGIATVGGLNETQMCDCLNAAEDFGLIGVSNRRGRYQATRWVRHSPTDSMSPEPRNAVVRSLGPTKAHNADALAARRAAKEAQASVDAAEARDLADRDAITAEWLATRPADQVYAYAAGDAPPF